METLSAIFIAVMQRIHTNCATVQWVDQNYGQIDSYDTRPPVKFPCVLIDVTNLVYEDNGKNTQLASGTVQLSISDAPVVASNMVTAEDRIKKAVEYYAVEQEVFKNLHGFVPMVGCSKLTRRSHNKVDREDAIRERLVIYDFTYTDCTAVKATQKVAVPDPIIGGDMLMPT